MLRNHSNADASDGPRTLCSGLHSPEISILRASPHSSLISNSLEISQSPTRALIQEPHKNQCSVLDKKTSCITSTTGNESSFLKPTPVEVPINPYTTNREEIQQPSGLLFPSSKQNEAAVSEDKNTDGQNFVPNFPRSPGHPSANLPETLHESFPRITIHERNSLSEPSCSLEPEPNISSSLDVPLSANSSEQFFSFVIFHAPEDQEIASKVCNVLDNLGVRKGTTFCEGFETPGVSPLTCLENAVENSAYIILLLTDAFLETTWGVFQGNTALMNSIQNPDKQGSVIPFYPYSKNPHPKIPIPLRTLLPLDERSPTFHIKVRNTFKLNVILEQYERWRRVKKRTDFHLPQQQNVSLQWYMGDANAVLPQQVFYGQPPVIQISHATNVQIGDHNRMNVQFSPNEPHMNCDTNIYAENETSN